MEKKFTKGPWVTQVHNVPGLIATVRTAPGNICIATIEGTDAYTRGQDVANASLMAAAPDLLKALEAIFNEEGSTVFITGSQESFARYAIAKAKGDLVGMWDETSKDERAELTKEFSRGFSEQLAMVNRRE